MVMGAISETRIFEGCLFTPIFDDFEIYAAFSRPGMGGGGLLLFRKGLDLEEMPIFLD